MGETFAGQLPVPGKKRDREADPDGEESYKRIHKDSFARILNREEQIKLHANHRKAVQGQFLDIGSDFKPPDFPKTGNDIVFLEAALGENFIFASLSRKERALLIKALQKQECAKGEVIIKQGDVGDYFYICESGTVNFIAGGKDVGSCGTGGSFGELALLYDAPRAATCIAGSHCSLWKLDQSTFKMLLARTSIDEETIIAETLAKIDLFKDLDKGVVSNFASVLSTVAFTAGEKIVKKGEQGDIFYIINEGKVRVHDIGLGDSNYADQILKQGDWYGERSLMTGEPRAANITAMTDVQAFAVDRLTFETTFGPLGSVLGTEAKKRFIKSVPIFEESQLLPIEYDHLESLMIEMKYDKGTKLAEPGKVSQEILWIVKEGKLMVTKSGGETFVLGSACYYGDKAIQNNSNSKYVSEDICVCEEDTTCWMLKREDIQSVIGDINRLGRPIPFVPTSQDSSINLKDVTRHKLLGMGAFGRVWLCSTKSDKTPYALKIVNKRRLLEANQVKGVIRERQIMSCIDHPFILGLVGSFQDDRNLYFLLPLFLGGELFNVIHNTNARTRGISNDASVFYGACILEAIGYLHARHIVYRDMKPENALIDDMGYCILIDFGFAKIIDDTTYTLCGTPEYLAPEIILSKGHNKAVDYWSFGVLIYEMLVGRSPFSFNGTDQVTLLKSIVMGKFSCPPSMDKKAVDLITKLLARRQSSRLGNLSHGTQDVKDHPWFKSLDFQKLNKRELDAPWIPKVKDPLDSSHYADLSGVENEDEACPALDPEEQKCFEDFLCR